jgi:predicted DNA-binding transcriptional regulator YafY
VRIRFSRRTAPYILERNWHPSQRIARQRDGGVVLTLRIADLAEVRRWLIGYGGEARVLAPEKLRQEIEAECARVLARKK